MRGLSDRGAGRGRRGAGLLGRSALVVVFGLALCGAWGVALAYGDVSPGTVDSSGADSGLLADAGASDSAPSAVALSSAGTLPGFQGQGAGAAGTPASAAQQQMIGAIENRVAAARGSLEPTGAAVLAPGLPARQVQQSKHGFDGINDLDQENAFATGIYAAESAAWAPPDQGLCVGNGFVMEMVNGGVRVFDTHGNGLTPTIDWHQFFGVPPLVFPNGTFGQYVSDPRCAYDAATQRWFAILFGSDFGPAPNFPFSDGIIHLIVSNTADPRGPYTDYSFQTTNFGRATSNPCPCFPDQPHIALDANGVYITTNQFSLSTNRFNSNQLFILSKQGLVNGTIQFFFRANTNVASVQGATPRTSGETDPADNGTEYFLASPLFTNGTSGLFLWSLTGTNSLADESGATVHLRYRISQLIAAEPFSRPALVTQRPGPTPFDSANGLPEGQLDPGPAAFQQLALANGHLWGAIPTALSDGTSNHSAIAWFSLIPTAPTATNSQPTATLDQQNYITVRGNDLSYPTIAVSATGTPVLGANLAGPTYYPSTVYGRLPAAPGSQAEQVLHLAGSGTAPLDTYTNAFGYERWGDYTNAVSDGTTVWIAGEYVPNRPRGALANWGTFITPVTDDGS